MSISDLLKFGGKRPNQSTGAGNDVSAATGADSTVVSKALPKFIAALSSTQSPMLIDFGPVIGPNVAFFGETLGCKLFIEDLAKDLERHTRAGTREELPDLFAKRFSQADGSVDGVLCWDIFDFLERPAAQALAKEVVRVLRAGWCAMGFFCTRWRASPSIAFTKFEIVEESTLRQRSHPGAGGPKFVLQNRDIIRMFEGLSVSDSFLLKSNTAGNAAAQAGVDVRPVHRAPDRLRHARPLRGHDEGRHARHLSRRDPRRHHPRRPAARRPGRRAGTRGRLPVLSAGTIFVAVVDPGVGSARRGIAAETGDYKFVAPDNGVLTAVLRETPPKKTVELTERRYARPTVSRTFEGRDRFAPAAAWLAKGIQLSALGRPVAEHSAHRDPGAGGVSRRGHAASCFASIASATWSRTSIARRSSGSRSGT